MSVIARSDSDEAIPRQGCRADYSTLHGKRNDPFCLGFGYIRRLKRTQYAIAMSDTSLLYPGY